MADDRWPDDGVAKLASRVGNWRSPQRRGRVVEVVDDGNAAGAAARRRQQRGDPPKLARSRRWWGRRSPARRPSARDARGRSSATSGTTRVAVSRSVDGEHATWSPATHILRPEHPIPVDFGTDGRLLGLRRSAVPAAATAIVPLPVVGDAECDCARCDSGRMRREGGADHSLVSLGGHAGYEQILPRCDDSLRKSWQFAEDFCFRRRPPRESPDGCFR